MKKLIILTGLLAATTMISAQTDVVTGVMRGKDYGVTYALPKTQIELEVKVNKITYTPGEFGKYADRYLRLNNISVDPKEYWELTSVKVKPVGVPDKENVYFVKMKDRTVAPLIELTEDGIIKSINVPIEGKKTLPAKTIVPAQKKVNPRDFLTEEILMASSTAKMAELVAKEIYNIRESKNALVRGQADNMPKDGAQLKLNNEVAFRFSKKLGVVANNDLAGEPVYITLKNLKTVNIPQDDGKKKVDGVAYNVPGKASILLTQGKDVLFEDEVPVTQFGTVEYLDPTLFNKNSTIKVTFNPVTGGLVKVDREEGK